MLWSLFRTLSRIGEPRMTQREQQRQLMEDALTQVICEGAARETMLVRRGLLPENWKQSEEHDIDQIKRMHETEMKRDPHYRSDYKAELEAARRAESKGNS